MKVLLYAVFKDQRRDSFTTRVRIKRSQHGVRSRSLKAEQCSPVGPICHMPSLPSDSFAFANFACRRLGIRQIDPDELGDSLLREPRKRC